MIFCQIDQPVEFITKQTDPVNFLNIRAPKQFVVFTLKVEKDGFSLE